MIAFAAMAVAVSAQAVSYTWGVMDQADWWESKSGALYSGAGKLFLFTGAITETAVDGGYQLSFESATLINSATADPGNVYGNVTWDFDHQIADARITQPSADKSVGSQPFQLLFVESTTASTIEDLEAYVGDYAIVGGSSSRGYDRDKDVEYAKLVYNDSIYQGDWKVAAAIPEPTSGLLLLLGVAGLALRRRRA